MSKLDALIDGWKKAAHYLPLEAFEERAGILEYDAGYSREESERLAMEEVEKRKAAVDMERVQK